MQPQLKIGPLINLQDARYSAAAGFDIVSFSLERGNSRKLSVPMIWNMVQWLTGPEIALEMNADSMEELIEANKTFPYGHITLPLESRNEPLSTFTSAKIIWKVQTDADPGELKQLIREETTQGRDISIELSLDVAAEFAPFREIAPYCLLHFSSMQALEDYLKQDGASPCGICLGLEAEEEPGVLDYERIDRIVERIMGE
jgi:hypothetical protein